MHACMHACAFFGVHVCVCVSANLCLTGGSSNAASDASTVVYPDAVAIENARKGCAAAKLQESQTPQQPAVANQPRPLMRVNSVPLLRETPPQTPADRIMRSMRSNTFDSGSTEPSSSPSTATPSDAVPAEPAEHEASPVSCGESKKKKKKRRVLKRGNKASTPNANQEETTTHEGAENPQPACEAEPAAKAAAVKSAPKPSRATNTDSANMGAASAPVPRPTSKQEKPATPPPEALQKAARDNLQRSSTAEQKTPVATPKDNSNQFPPASAALMPSSQQQQPQEGELEKALGKEIKKEAPPATTSSKAEAAHPAAAPVDNAALAVPAPPSVAAGTPAAPAPDTCATNPSNPTERANPPKKRREKTPAEKAAHARYMRFSRSFDRSLVNLGYYFCSGSNLKSPLI